MSTEEIRQRITEIENILFSPDAYSQSYILKRVDKEARLEHEQRMDGLRRERETLLRQLPPTGEASGQHLVIARNLGTVYVRKSEPEYQISQADLDREDPYLRFMHESGEDWR